ncbi:MAG: hypothetical protein OXI79_21110 [Gammaproteobacteria bacterium]|nr:hypothetical protein [Gammaproteobacteria bacterium]
MRRTVATCLVGTALHVWPVAGQEHVPVIAVAEVESGSALLPGPTVRVAIESALAEMPAFTTLKRKELAAVLEASDISLADIGRGDQAFREASGVDYVLTGRARASVASKLSPLGTLLRVLRSGSECTAAVRLDVGIVAIGTGDTAFSARVTHREPVEVVYPPGADYSDPCQYANRSRKWRALEAALDGVALEVARKLTLALFPMRLLRVADTGVTLNYGESFLSVGDQLKVVAPIQSGGESESDTPVVGYLAVSAVGSRTAVADVIYARRPLTAGDGAAVLAKDEGKRLERLLAAMARTAAKQERACENARKRVRRYCPRDPDSRRCRSAEAAVKANCDKGR